MSPPFATRSALTPTAVPDRNHIHMAAGLLGDSRMVRGMRVDSNVMPGNGTRLYGCDIAISAQYCAKVLRVPRTWLIERVHVTLGSN